MHPSLGRKPSAGLTVPTDPMVDSGHDRTMTEFIRQRHFGTEVREDSDEEQDSGKRLRSATTHVRRSAAESLLGLDPSDSIAFLRSFAFVDPSQGTEQRAMSCEEWKEHFKDVFNNVKPRDEVKDEIKEDKDKFKKDEVIAIGSLTVNYLEDTDLLTSIAADGRRDSVELEEAIGHPSLDETTVDLSNPSLLRQTGSRPPLELQQSSAESPLLSLLPLLSSDFEFGSASIGTLDSVRSVAEDSAEYEWLCKRLSDLKRDSTWKYKSETEMEDLSKSKFMKVDMSTLRDLVSKDGGGFKTKTRFQKESATHRVFETDSSSESSGDDKDIDDEIGCILPAAKEYRDEYQSDAQMLLRTAMAADPKMVRCVLQRDFALQRERIEHKEVATHLRVLQQENGQRLKCRMDEERLKAEMLSELRKRLSVATDADALSMIGVEAPDALRQFAANGRDIGRTVARRCEMPHLEEKAYGLLLDKLAEMQKKVKVGKVAMAGDSVADAKEEEAGVSSGGVVESGGDKLPTVYEMAEELVPKLEAKVKEQMGIPATVEMAKAEIDNLTTMEMRVHWEDLGFAERKAVQTYFDDRRFFDGEADEYLVEGVDISKERRGYDAFVEEKMRDCKLFDDDPQFERGVAAAERPLDSMSTEQVAEWLKQRGFCQESVDYFDACGLDGASLFALVNNQM